MKITRHRRTHTPFPTQKPPCLQHPLHPTQPPSQPNVASTPPTPPRTNYCIFSDCNQHRTKRPKPRDKMQHFHPDPPVAPLLPPQFRTTSTARCLPTAPKFPPDFF